MLCIRNVEKQGVIGHRLIKHDDNEKEKKKGRKKNKKGTGSVEFHDFIVDVKSKLPTNNKYYLLLDNASIHRAIGVLRKTNRFPIKELMSQMNICPIYLVAYCPQLNPVELIFNFLRHYVEKHEPRSYEELKLVIEKGISELQEKDMTKYFRHCLEYDFSTINNLK